MQIGSTKAAIREQRGKAGTWLCSNEVLTSKLSAQVSDETSHTEHQGTPGTVTGTSLGTVREEQAASTDLGAPSLHRLCSASLPLALVSLCLKECGYKPSRELWP